MTVSCNFQSQEYSKKVQENKPEPDKAMPLILSGNLEERNSEFKEYLKAAEANIRNFAVKNGWQDLTKESFFDSVMIFDNKNDFNIALLKLAEADTNMQLPETYCAALEKRTLIAVSPELYAEVYPEGIEKDSYTKLLTHEIAHRLHIRILQGNEEAMGPVWFYEGFALYAADQFDQLNLELDGMEIAELMGDPERGSYEKYSFIFRYFAKKVELKELILKAKEDNFNDWLISKID
jgi:hypothetical protein